MKKYLVFILSIALLSSCSHKGTNEGSESGIDTVKVNPAIQQLQQTVNERDSSINSFIQSINEIEGTLLEIKEKQHILSLNNKDVEHRKNKQEQIIADIKDITDLMLKNKQAMNLLQSKLKKAGVKMSELEKMINNLNKKIEAKDVEVASLKDSLGKVNTQLKTLFADYNAKVDVVNQQTKQLNTAYYVVGTFKDLKKNGILTKAGGFIGIGRAEELVKDFKKDYFTKIDITQNKTIPIHTKTAKVITSHPSAAYKLEGVEMVNDIMITNPEQFWSTSKYLVVVAE